MARQILEHGCARIRPGRHDDADRRRGWHQPHRHGRGRLHAGVRMHGCSLRRMAGSRAWGKRPDQLGWPLRRLAQAVLHSAGRPGLAGHRPCRRSKRRHGFGFCRPIFQHGDRSVLFDRNGYAQRIVFERRQGVRGVIRTIPHTGRAARCGRARLGPIVGRSAVDTRLGDCQAVWSLRETLAHGEIDCQPVVAGAATDVADRMSGGVLVAQPAPQHGRLRSQAPRRGHTVSADPDAHFTDSMARRCPLCLPPTRD